MSSKLFKGDKMLFLNTTWIHKRNIWWLLHIWRSDVVTPPKDKEQDNRRWYERSTRQWRTWGWAGDDKRRTLSTELGARDIQSTSENQHLFHQSAVMRISRGILMNNETLYFIKEEKKKGQNFTGFFLLWIDFSNIAWFLGINQHINGSFFIFLCWWLLGP